jgi:hypothetical protein
MNTQTKSNHAQPDRSAQDKPKDDGVTNDSLGTVDPADSTGLDDQKEIDKAKKGSEPSRVDSAQA